MFVFYGCSFPAITLPENLRAIKTGAFYDLSSLTSVTFPDNLGDIVNEIGKLLNIRDLDI